MTDYFIYASPQKYVFKHMDLLAGEEDRNVFCNALENGAGSFIKMKKTIGLKILGTYLCSRHCTKCFTYIILFIPLNKLVSLGFDLRSRTTASNIKDLIRE